jgi:YHS domain-containing protein
MNSKKMYLSTIALFVSLLLVSLIVSGCKCCDKKSEKCMTHDKASMGMEQTVCPVSGMQINKDISTTYKGKTVYFCSPACKTEFEKNPEKYTDKLPQFKSDM